MHSKLLSLVLLFPLVSAHGYLASVSIDGTVYQGNAPSSGSSDSAIRLVDQVNPVKGATNAAINCGQDAQAGTVVADASPGSTLTFTWVNGDGGTVSLFFT